jgi:hypothetical protein
MKEGSARANVLSGLKLVKIVDDDGKPTELARRWRDDAQYQTVCREILDACYPRELLDAVPDPAADRKQAERWFANHTGGGEGSASKLAKFYTLLTEANFTKATADKPEKATAGARTTPKKTTPKVVTPNPIATKTEDRTDPPRTQGKGGPAIHINLQVHISADASTEQIDQVFSSMAKHIYPKGVE